MAGAYCQQLEGERGGAMTQVLEEDTTPKSVGRQSWISRSDWSKVAVEREHDTDMMQDPNTNLGHLGYLDIISLRLDNKTFKIIII